MTEQEREQVQEAVQETLNGAYGTGYILFTRPYDDGGYWGFIKPYGVHGRRNNVFYTNKSVSPLLDSILVNDAEGAGASARRIEVSFYAETTSRGPRAVQVWVD
jgi:hypothetical protein